MLSGRFIRRLSTSQKLALANAAVLAASFGLLLLLVTWLAERFILGHLGESLDAEIHILESDFVIDGLPGVRALIEQRMHVHSTNQDRSYLLEDAQGHRLAGNLDHWPASDTPYGAQFRAPSQHNGRRTNVLFQWLWLPDHSRLLVGYDEMEVQQVRTDLRRAALWSLGVTLLVSLVAGRLITRTVLRPVEAIRQSALRIMHGDLSHRIALRRTDDEFDRLGETLNAMLDRIEKLIASVKGATDDIAHDLRSPLTRHRSRLEAFLHNLPNGSAQRDPIEQSLSDLDQVLATFQSLLRIASVESGVLRAEFGACDLGVLLHDAVEFVEPLAEEKGQRIRLSADQALRLNGHRDLLFQALVNLLDNAIKYGPEGGQVTVVAKARATGVLIAVADQGPGIPEAERERVFERLYRLDRARNTPGLGLGLALVKVIVEVHRGEITVMDNHPGARLEVRLPV